MTRSGRLMFSSAGSLLAAALVFTSEAQAQRSTENAVTEAEDAFGVSIGRETIGLYNSSSVRGFSPVSAGNVRIDGLYFDQVWGLNARIRRSTTIRVGLSSLGFPFPSPTGVVDYAFRPPGDERRTSAYTYFNSYGAAGLEADFVLPVSETLSLGAGLAAYSNEFSNGTDSFQHIKALSARWTPAPRVEIIPFWTRSDIEDDENGPLYLPAGNFLPPTSGREFYGPDWAVYRSTAVNYGSLANFAPADNWRIRAGLFRSLFDDKQVFANLLIGVTPEGDVAQHLLLADPPSKTASTSGEIRSTHSLSEGPRLHVLHFAIRGRDRTRRTGGSDVIDLGPTRIDTPVLAPAPVFEFGPQTHDRVKQWTAGLAYEGRWRGVGELSASLQKTDYAKRIAQPSLPLAETTASPWLYNATAALYLGKDLVAYAGYARGLEESGVAPDSASNRAEALPAIETEQIDAGLRWTIRDGLRLVVGVFDFAKPYFNLDETSRFTLLGDVRHRGAELSLSGSLPAGFNIVMGAVLIDPEVTGDGVRLGRVGPKPVGLAERTLTLNLDWRHPAWDQVSFDVGLNHEGPRPATRDNLLVLPERTRVDLGARYRFEIAGKPATFRLAVTNVFDVDSLDLKGAGTFDSAQGRLFTASLAADF